MILLGQQLASQRQFQKGYTFLYRAAGDSEEVSAIGLGEATVALGNICGNRERGAVELVDEESVAARELLCLATDFVGEVDGFLIDDELFEGERHEPGPRFRE